MGWSVPFGSVPTGSVSVAAPRTAGENVARV